MPPKIFMKDGLLNPLLDVKQALQQQGNDQAADTKRHVKNYQFEARRNQEGLVVVKIIATNHLAESPERTLADLRSMTYQNRRLPERHPSKWASAILEMYEAAVEFGEAWIIQEADNNEEHR